MDISLRNKFGQKFVEGRPYVILFVSTFILYAKSLGFEFIPTWDDSEYVMTNPLILSLSCQNIKEIFTSTLLSNYAPLHIISYAFDYALWGLNPAGYHLFNIMLHGVNACVLYTIIKKISGLNAVALTAALLFAIHPVNVENTAWVSERKTLLATTFFFLSIYCYLEFRTSDAIRFYSLTIIFFALAVLTKASVIILPLIFVAYELILNKKTKKWSPLIPLFVLSIAGALLVIWAHLQGKSFEEGALSPAVLFGTVYPTMVPVFWKYIFLIVFPFNLSGYYDTSLFHSFFEFPVLVSLISWIIVLLLVVLKGNAQVRFWFLWFWICLLPASNIIPLPVYYADRYMYAPGIGLFVLGGLALHRLFLSKRRISLYSSVVLIAVLYSITAYDRLHTWHDEVTFWRDTALKSPHQYKPRLNLGVAYEKRDLLSNAEDEYRRAIDIYPGREAVYNLRMVRMKMNLRK